MLERVRPTALWRALASLAILVLVVLPPARQWTPVVYAASRTWTGSGANNAWRTDQNWDGNVAPTTDDSLTFPAGAAPRTSVNNFPADTRFESIVFFDTDYRLQGNRVALTGGLASISSTIQFANRIQLPIRVLNSQTFKNGSPNALLAIDGAIILDNGATLQLNEGGDPMGTLQLLGVVSGNGSIVTGGPGGILGGNNTYTGATNVERNPLAILSSNGLGATSGPTLVKSGGVLILDSLLEPSGLIVPEPVSLVNGGTLRSRRGTNTLSGPVSSLTQSFSNEVNALEADAGQQLLITGIVDGNVRIAKRGPGTVALTGNNTFTNNLDVEAGILRLSGAQALGTNTSNQTLVLANAALELDSTGVGSFTLGELINLADRTTLRNLAGNNILSGEIIVNPGTQTIAVDAPHALRLSGVINGLNTTSASVLQMQGTGRLQLAGNQANFFQSVFGTGCGTLELNKSAGVTAVPANLLILGLGCPSGSRATARLLADEQIADSSLVLAGGLLDIGDKHETIAALTGAGEVLLDRTENDRIVGGRLRLTGIDPTSTTPPFTGSFRTTGDIFMLGPGRQEIDSASQNYRGTIHANGGTLFLNGDFSNAPLRLGSSGNVSAGFNGGLNLQSVITNGGRMSVRNLVTSSGPITLDGTQMFFNDSFEASPPTLRGDQTVQLNNPILALDNDGGQDVGEVALLVDKRSPGPIAGTFAGLPEGAITEVNGILGRMSYVGGDGNDATFTSFVRRCPSATRPAVSVQTRQLSASVLEATVTAMTNQAVPSNQLVLMDFAPPPTGNANVIVPAQPGVPAQTGGTGLFNLLIDPPQPSIRFTIQQIGAGQPATSFFTAFDRCGRWQSLSGAGTGIFGTVGAFSVEPSAATIAPGETLPLSFRWSVPPPQVWRDLRSLRLRMSGPQGPVLQVRWDESSDAFVVESSVTPALFELGAAKSQGSGPTGQSVTLTLPIRALPAAAGQTFTLEVQGTDDAGTVQGFEAAGTLTVGPLAGVSAPAASPIPVIVPVVLPEPDPSPRKLTAEQRQQRRRTDASSLDDTRTEGSIIESDCAAEPPTATIAGMDGSVTLRLHDDAARLCRALTNGMYVRAEGEKVHELLYEIDSIDLD
jgi:autotransporter-associated beta strand protein